MNFEAIFELGKALPWWGPLNRTDEKVLGYLVGNPGSIAYPIPAKIGISPNDLYPSLKKMCNLFMLSFEVIGKTRANMEKKAYWPTVAGIMWRVVYLDRKSGSKNGILEIVMTNDRLFPESNRLVQEIWSDTTLDEEAKDDLRELFAISFYKARFPIIAPSESKYGGGWDSPFPLTNETEEEDVLREITGLLIEKLEVSDGTQDRLQEIERASKSYLRYFLKRYLGKWTNQVMDVRRARLEKEEKDLRDLGRLLAD